MDCELIHNPQKGFKVNILLTELTILQEEEAKSLTYPGKARMASYS